MFKFMGDDDTMCNESNSCVSSDHRDSIELTITVAGHRYNLKRDLPLVVRASTGRMSIRSGLEPTAIKLLHEIVHEMLHDAAAILDHGMPHPREVRWTAQPMRFEEGDG